MIKKYEENSSIKLINVKKIICEYILFSFDFNFFFKEYTPIRINKYIILIIVYAKLFIITTPHYFILFLSLSIIISSDNSSCSNFLKSILFILVNGIDSLNTNLTGILNGSFSFRGEGLMLAAAASYGISNVYLKKIVKQESPMAITSYQILFGSLLMIIIGICMGGRVQVYSLKAACLLLYLAALSAAAFSIWTLLLKYNPVGKVTMFAFSIPVFGVIMSGIFLGESVFSMKNIIALVLVSVGIGVVNAKHGEQHYL